MIIWHVNDFGGSMLSTISQNARDLPAPLPWIEPSINNLHLESVYSFLVGNYECSIMSISSLLEHVLRLAIKNKQFFITKQANRSSVNKRYIQWL